MASSRINRYEKGVHHPDPVTIQRMADALGVPAAYLLASNDRLARLILAFDSLPVKVQERLVSEVERKANVESADVRELRRRTGRVQRGR